MLINQKKYKKKKYSSGELRFVRSELDSFIENGEVEIFLENDYPILELSIVLKYYKLKGVMVKLVLSYLPYQRMDHKGRDKLDTLTYVAYVINDLHLDGVVICEPHCEIDDFDNAKKFDFVRAIKNDVFNEIGFDEEKDFVVLTDKGGAKRYSGIAKNMTYFNKERSLETGLIVKQEIIGNIDISKKIVIVDDIISSGDTIVGIVEYLKELGAKEIYVLSGHIENNKSNKRLEQFDEVKMIFSTNSLKKRGTKKIKIFDCGEVYYGKRNDW